MASMKNLHVRAETIAEARTGSTSSRPSISSTDVLTAAKGGGITFIGRLFALAGQFTMGILIARFMGAEQYGLYSLADTTLSLVVAMALLGLSAGIVRYVSVFAHLRDEESLWGTLQVGMGIPLVVGTISGVFMYIFADPLARHVFHEPRLVPLLRIVAFMILFGVLSSTAASAIQGFKRLRYRVIAQDIVSTLVKMFLVVILALIGLNAVRATAAYAISIVTAALLLLYFLNKLFRLNRPLKAARLNARQMLAFSMPVYLSGLIALFGNNLQVILLGMLGTVVSVGVFTAASRISLAGQMFHNSIVEIAMPIVSELYSDKKMKQLGHFYQTVTKWTFTFNLPLLLISVLFSKPLLSIFGEDFTTGSVALIILSLGNLANAGTGICGVIVTMTGYTWLNTLNSILALVTTLSLNVLLIPVWGYVGAAIATALGITVVNVVRLIEVFVLFRLLPYNVGFIKPILAGSAAAAASFFVTRWLYGGANLIYVFLNIAFLLVVYVLVIWLLRLSEEDRAVLERVHYRLKTLIRL
jgi:O-antigen/teichoic acid export membrane protein